MDAHELKLLRQIPSDHSHQVGDWYFASRIGEHLPAQLTQVELLDLGAGDGSSLGHLKAGVGQRELNWIGVDIEDSDEIRTRPTSAPSIDYYNGVDLPYETGRFDVVWSRQVLEHVRYPDKVIAEVARVLKPNGIFAGSVSQLEPYHSRSIFNWTHYGVATVFGDHGLEVREMRPGVDGITLLMRSLFGRRTNLNRFFRVEAPVNVLLQNMFVIDDAPRSNNVRMANFQKLKATGHIHFVAVKAG